MSIIITNNEQKQNYVTAYLEREVVNLDINNIVPDRIGMKAISKLFLNSLWGRFGLNSNKTQHKLITECVFR